MKSKNKGNRNELFIANLFTERFGQVFKRVPMSGAIGTNLSESNIRQDVKEILSGDIICPPNFRFNIEVKSRFNFNFWNLLNKEDGDIDSWIKQAKKEAEISKKEFMLIIKINNKKPFVIIPFSNIVDTDFNKLNCLSYKNYIIIRLDYLLQFEDRFFFESKK